MQKIQNADGSFKKSYRKWSSMHRRCVDVRHPSYPRYGGRGIYVCLRWSGKDGYANFVEDMGEPPEGLTLGRKEGDKPYEKDNCRWETWKQQAANREGAGAPRRASSLMSRARKAGLPYMVVYHRIHTLHWPTAKALRQPVGPRGSVSIMQKAIDVLEGARLVGGESPTS